MKASLEHTASGTDILHCLETASVASGKLGKGRSSRHGSAGGLSTDEHAGSSSQYATLFLACQAIPLVSTLSMLPRYH